MQASHDELWHVLSAVIGWFLFLCVCWWLVDRDRREPPKGDQP